MIIGTGIDLLDIRRIADSLQRHDERLAKRVLHPDELAVFRQRGGAQSVRGQRYVASRFAAKEAFAKAWGSGIGAQVSFQGLSILNDAAGAPLLQCHGALGLVCQQRNIKAWVSLTDAGDWVIAQVILEAVCAPA